MILKDHLFEEAYVGVWDDIRELEEHGRMEEAAREHDSDLKWRAVINDTPVDETDVPF